jgi:hypothetical protein
LICLNIFYRTEWNGIEKPIDIFGIKTMFKGVSQSLASLISLIIFYGMEWNGMEKPIDIFGIKTMLTGVSQSLA